MLRPAATLGEMAQSDPATMSMIYFVRHGQNLANVDHVLSHRVVDYSLTERGRRQARAIAEWLRERPIRAIYSSPLGRARETAAIIVSATGARLFEVEALREVDVGELDGRSDGEAWAVYESTVAAWRRAEWWARFPGSEDLREARRRITSVVEDVVRRHPGQDVVVVGHGEILGAALPPLLGLCDPPVMTTGSITAVRCAGPGGLSCESWGLIEHLPDDLAM